MLLPLLLLRAALRMEPKDCNGPLGDGGYHAPNRSLAQLELPFNGLTVGRLGQELRAFASYICITVTHHSSFRNRSVLPPRTERLTGA